MSGLSSATRSATSRAVSGVSRRVTPCGSMRSGTAIVFSCDARGAGKSCVRS